MPRLREKFMRDNKGKTIKLVFSNGFQLSGRLVDYDENDVLVETNAYSSAPVTIPQASVNVFVPVTRK